MAPVVYRLLTQEMDTVTQVQILDKAVCISHRANTLGKGKIEGQTRLFSLGMATSLGEGNSDLKAVKLHIKTLILYCILLIQ